MTDNPFQSPPIEERAAEVRPTGDTLQEIGRSVFLAWEKIRPLYNLALVAIVLCTTWLIGFNILWTAEFWGTTLGGAFIANLCYFAAPISETYVSWLGFQGEKMRWPLFLLGTAFAGLLAIVAIIVQL